MAGMERRSRTAAAARWRERLARWQRRGGSISEFCRREGISQPSFFQWRKRLSGEILAATGSAFLPIEVAADGSWKTTASDRSRNGATECEFVFGGLVCRVPSGVDEPTLRRLVRVLREEASRC